MKSALFILLLLAALTGLSFPVSAAHAPAAQIDFAAIDGFITAQMDKHGLMGVSLAITRGEEIIYLRGYGSAGDNRPMTPQTPMYIGSQSKSITALAIAQLVEQGKINEKAPVQTYLPWFRVADPAASAKITASHFLHHTSGLSEAGFTTILPENSSIEDVVRALKDARLTAPVGEQFQYFNIGFDVLAEIVQVVSGQPYEEYVQQHIFDPLEMTRTYTDPDLAQRNGLSQGYSRFFGVTVPRKQIHRDYEIAAGYIISTAEDMAHYAIAMNNSTRYAGNQLLGAKQLKRMFTPVLGCCCHPARRNLLRQHD